MTEFRAAVPRDVQSHGDPFRVLHLLPTASHELVVEVYWHLVGQLRTASPNDPATRTKLDELNRAYAFLTDRSVPLGEGRPIAGSNGPLGNKASTVPKPTPRLLRFRPKQSRPDSPASRESSTRELLHVSPGAPTEVVELAYKHERLRVRSLLGPAGAAEVARLQGAYEALMQGGTPATCDGGGSEGHAATPGRPPSHEATVMTPATEGIGPRSPAPTSWAQRVWPEMSTPGAAPPTEPDAQEPLHVTSGAFAALAEARTHLVPAQPIGRWTPAGSDAHAATGRFERQDEQLPSHQVPRRARRWVAAGTARLGHWARPRLVAGWTRTVIVLKKRVADPFGEYRPDAPPRRDVRALRTAAEYEERRAVEDRLAALAESREQLAENETGKVLPKATA